MRQSNQSIWYNSSGANLYQSINLKSCWEQPDKTDNKWKAPDGIDWICGQWAYRKLPRKGTCTLGIIQPSFFTLPQSKDNVLGIALYETLKRHRRGMAFPKGKDEWPVERIISYYDPATWVQDRSWGHRIPIYLLSQLIKLRAIVEVISNRTADTRALPAWPTMQIWAELYQNRWALAYLLAEEGEVCGKWNHLECCLEIDDNGKIVRQLADELNKVANTCSEMEFCLI